MHKWLLICCPPQCVRNVDFSFVRDKWMIIHAETRKETLQGLWELDTDFWISAAIEYEIAFLDNPLVSMEELDRQDAFVLVNMDSIPNHTCVKDDTI